MELPSTIILGNFFVYKSNIIIVKLPRFSPRSCCLYRQNCTLPHFLTTNPMEVCIKGLQTCTNVVRVQFFSLETRRNVVKNEKIL